MASSAAAAPIVTLVEKIDPPDPPDFDGLGQYTIIVGDLEGNVIVGFFEESALSLFLQAPMAEPS